MSTPNQLDDVRLPDNAGEAPVFAILFTIGLCHLLNDIIGGLVPALYPLFKRSYNLTFSQIGLITLTYQITSSLLQPLVGLYTDRRPRPFSLVAGMTVTLARLDLAFPGQQLSYHYDFSDRGGRRIGGLSP